jgi:peptidoglycan/LPS O-acetylase OafA/YrhL
MGKSGTPGKEHLQFLDHLRGVAILSVFVFHSLGAAFGGDRFPWGGFFSDFRAVSRSFVLLTPVTFGWAGVALFFVISGFCIHLSFARSPERDWHRFFVRRFFRIYPPYFAALVVFSVLFPITRVHVESRVGLSQLASHLFLIHNLSEKAFFGINGSFWSIAVEVQLYLIYPVLLALVKRVGWVRALLLLGTLEIALRGFDGALLVVTGRELPRLVSGLPFYFWFSWAIGAAVADSFIRKAPLPFLSISWKTWFLCAIFAWMVKPLSPYSFLLFSLATAAGIAGTLNKGSSGSLRYPHLYSHLRNLGLWSYSFYLLHEPLVNAIPWMIAKLNVHHVHPFLIFALCLSSYPLVVKISALSYKYCEVPSMAFGRRFERSKMSYATSEKTSA